MATQLAFPQMVSSKHAGAKAISPDLFGIFFEDISYAADGGLYAELVQNRSFEYGPADRKGWDPLTGWEYRTEGYGYGNLSVETAEPVHANNPHYVVLTVEDPGQEGIGLSNGGFDGMALKNGGLYNFSGWMRQLPDGGKANDQHTDPAARQTVEIQLRGRKGAVLGKAELSIVSDRWQEYKAAIRVSGQEDSAYLVVLAKARGKLALDEISLFPDQTFKHRANGMRDDLAQAIADLHPKFMRFPGGCLVHGDGLGNMYRWKNTIGPLEQRREQKNIWSYHQTTGLGFFEYFQFCEDIGAKPVPIVAAGVSCQNSGGTWRIGGTGQKGIAMEDMQSYIQDVLDLIEYANGPETTVWGAKRAASGHPAPFHLQYIGIGNEDKQTDIFRQRFNMLYAAVHAKHPEITVIGTAGPFPSGEDYELGWRFADSLSVAMVDEHYYEKPEWFLANGHRYDKYDRSRSKVYVGEYASWGNTLYNALAEAAYMTSLERNGDVVHMASYAPLLANVQHTSWNPDLIYFSNTKVLRTANYYVQQLFAVGAGDVYHPGIISAAAGDTGIAFSCVSNSLTGEVVLKIVHTGPGTLRTTVDLSTLGKLGTNATRTVLAGTPDAKNTEAAPNAVVPVDTQLAIQKKFVLDAPAYSLQVIRIKRPGRAEATAGGVGQAGVDVVKDAGIK
jgi:alpha-L-arabinofuranosidase